MINIKKTMRIKEILVSQLASIKPSEKEISKINQITSGFSNLLISELRKGKIKADVFIGGSLAKNTVIKKMGHYDIDIFVRFDYARYSIKSSQLSNILALPLQKVAKKLKLKPFRIHGSRDYFNLLYKGIFFEIIPILKIEKASQALNITDISPLHVRYVVNKISKNKKLADEIRFAKTFCFMQGCYGAESYIRGFSGYSLEVLCIHFGSFLNFLKAAEKWSETWHLKKKIIIDPAKHYKNREDILVLLNEAKLQSPLILIDPVQKERNVTAALSSATFEAFLHAVHEFMKKPNASFFSKKPDVAERLRKAAKVKKANFATIIIEPASERIDIAGAKSLRFSTFLTSKLEKEGFSILNSELVFSIDQKKGFLHLIYKKPSRKILVKGPPVRFDAYVEQFKKKYKKNFEKKGRVYALIDAKFKKMDSFLKDLLKNYEKEIKLMLIKKVHIKKY